MYVDNFLWQHGHFNSSVFNDIQHVPHFFQPLPRTEKPIVNALVSILSQIFLHTFNQKHHHYNQLLHHTSHISGDKLSSFS